MVPFELGRECTYLGDPTSWPTRLLAGRATFLSHESAMDLDGNHAVLVAYAVRLDVEVVIRRPGVLLETSGVEATKDLDRLQRLPPAGSDLRLPTCESGSLVHPIADGVASRGGPFSGNPCCAST